MTLEFFECNLQIDSDGVLSEGLGSGEDSILDAPAFNINRIKVLIFYLKRDRNLLLADSDCDEISNVLLSIDG